MRKALQIFCRKQTFSVLNINIKKSNLFNITSIPKVNYLEIKIIN